MGRTTIVFECVAKTSEREDLEYQIYNEVKKRKKTICEEENAAIKDFYWSECNIFDSDNQATVFLSYRRYADFDGITIEELKEKLEDLKEELEEAEEEFDEIEYLDEDGYDDYDFESEEEYKERFRELELDIFIHESDIELIEKIIKEKD